MSASAFGWTRFRTPMHAVTQCVGLLDQVFIVVFARDLYNCADDVYDAH